MKPFPRSGVGLSLLSLALGASGQGTVVFRDSFEDPTRVAEWSFLARTAFGPATLDSRAVYGQVTTGLVDGVTVPPLNGQSTPGLYFEVNRKTTETASIEAMLGAPRTPALGNSYEIEFDLFYHYGVGSTTMLMVTGVGHDGTTPWLNASGTAPGYFFGTTADGSSGTADYRYWRGVTLQPTGTGAQGTGTGLWDHTNAHYQALLPKPPFAIAGAVGKTWLRVRVVRRGTYVGWQFNNQVVLAADDATFSAGGPALGMMDPTGSPSPVGMFVLVDNVVVRRNSPAVPLSCQVTFSDWVGAQPYATLTPVIWRRVGQTVPYAKITVPVPTSGQITITPPERGDWIVHFPARRPYLGRSVRISTQQRNRPLAIDFFNGDVDGDNAVTLFDLDYLSTHIDKTSASPGWSTPDADGRRPSDADLDGDLAVTLFDYDIVTRNFDRLGDP